MLHTVCVVNCLLKLNRSYVSIWNVEQGVAIDVGGNTV